jgi:hypothetical protein
MEEKIIAMLEEKAKCETEFSLINVRNGEDVDVNRAAWSVAIRVHEVLLGLGHRPALTGDIATSARGT